MRSRRPGLPGLLLLAFALGAAQGCEEPPVTPLADPVPPDSSSPSSPSSEITAWLDATAHPFEGTDLSLPHSDIQFLRDIVGDARIVALGENTRGTRDFFEMKARVLRFLVEEMGFTALAMQVNGPEATRIDSYVRTGAGDPERLLSGLYRWWWNTESVLETIEWMREHNAAGGDVGFAGFDMLYPGMPLHNIRQFLHAVDPVTAG